MKESLKAPLLTLIKSLVSAVIVFGSAVLGNWLGDAGSASAVALLGASVGTSVLVG